MLRPICLLVLVASVLFSSTVSAQGNNADNAQEITDHEQRRMTVAYECVLYDVFMDSVLRAIGFSSLSKSAGRLLGAPEKTRRTQFKAFKDQLNINVNLSKKQYQSTT